MEDDKERMDDPIWERKKGKDGLTELGEEERKGWMAGVGEDGWPGVGEEEGMQEEERKPWMT